MEIRHPYGLHLRPAAVMVKLASRYASEIRLHCRDKVFDAKSVLDLMGALADRGTRLVLEAEGPDSDAAVEELAAFVNANFHEDDDGNILPSGRELYQSTKDGCGEPGREGRSEG